MAVTVAYIHTSHVLIPIFSEISRRELPGVEQFHIVDESLIKNTIRDRRLTPTTTRRVIGLVQLAREGGADAVVVTCSSIGPAAAVASRLFEFPVVRVDDAMAEEAVRAGNRIGVAATLCTTLEPTLALLKEKAEAAHREVELVESLCEGAFEAIVAGDRATHDRMLSESLRKLMAEVDVVVLAQASMAGVVNAMPDKPATPPILTSPERAVRRARQLLFPTSADAK